MTHDCHPYNIRISGMNYNADYMPAIFQSNIFPAFPSIFATPYSTKTFTYVSPHSVFAFSDIHYHFIRRRHSYCTNRAAIIFVRNVFPVAGTISCFPDATTCATEVKSILVFITSGHRPASSAPPGTNKPVFGF